MKKAILLVMACAVVGTTIYSQTPVKERYTVSGGLLGAANFSKFRVNDDQPVDLKYSTEPSWAAGVWLNIPVSKGFSIEPQASYSVHRYRTNSTLTGLLTNGKISFIEVPLLLKFHLGDKFALTAGPQLDFRLSVDDNNNNNTVQDDDFESTSFSAFGGFELFPHGRVTIFGRYVHGLSDMNERPIESGGIELRNQNIQAGLKLKLFGKKIEADSDGDGVIDKKDKCPNVVGVARYDGCPIPDSDNDGVNDEQDKCPNQAGLAKYNGCPIPDTDKDGVNDEEDKCPNEAGLAKYNGCPIPDSDKDGVNDEEDKCPNQAGPASRNGCPVADRDNDGVDDDNDKCPDVAGTTANKGCPDVPANVSKTLGTSAQNISFGAANAKLTTRSNASLNQVVTIMNENPTLRIRIEGHTDNAGNDETNMKLSEDRANAVKNYLVSKGISEDRITAEGFGETMPIADNGTAAGRTKNRRIEIKIVY